MIKRVLSLLLLLSLPLLASHYNSTVLKIEAKLFPKMALLNENLDKNSTELKLYILALPEDFNRAKELKNFIEFYYQEKVGGKDIRVSIKQFKDFEKLPDALIILHHSPEELTKIAHWANRHKIVTLAYDPSYMEYGLLSSIYIGKSVKPYLNREVIQKYNFIFNPNLLKLSKFR